MGWTILSTICYFIIVFDDDEIPEGTKVKYEQREVTHKDPKQEADPAYYEKKTVKVKRPVNKLNMSVVKAFMIPTILLGTIGAWIGIVPTGVAGRRLVALLHETPLLLSCSNILLNSGLVARMILLFFICAAIVLILNRPSPRRRKRRPRFEFAALVEVLIVP